MSKKRLLNENTIRRFMKLAFIEPLAENFVENTKEEDIEEGYGAMPGNRDLPPGEGEEFPEPGTEEELPEPGAEEELPVEDVPEDLPPGEGEGVDLGLSPEAAEEVAEKLASGFAEVVQDALGVEGLLSVEKEGEGEAEVGGEAELELPPPEEEVGLPAEEEELPDDEPIMQEGNIDALAKKVAERLLEKKKQQKTEKDKKEVYLENLTDQIVERIFSASNKKNK